MSDFASAAAAWWRGLTDKDHGDRAAVAQLRRVEIPLDALAVPATHGLAKTIDKVRNGWPRANPETLALLAAVLAQVRTDDGRSLPRLCGAGDPPKLAHGRFQQLLRARTFADRLPTLRRALMITDRTAAVRPLVGGIAWWTDSTRQDWTFEYFATAPAQAEEPKA